MCQTCKDVASLSPTQALKRIGEEMKKGRDPEHFKKVMDKLLGTEEPEQNAEIDAAFENNRRRG